MAEQVLITNGKLIKAHDALADLKGQTVSSPAKARKIWNLWKQAEAAMAFHVAEERKLIAKYHATVDEDGRVLFETLEDRDAYLKEWNELTGLPAEGKIVPVVLSEADKIRISAEAMGALEGLVDFTE